MLYSGSTKLSDGVNDIEQVLCPFQRRADIDQSTCSMSKPLLKEVELSHTIELSNPLENFKFAEETRDLDEKLQTISVNSCVMAAGNDLTTVSFLESDQ